MAALTLLRDAGRIGDDYPVPVKVVSDAEALAASLIENLKREPMHQADAAVAFDLLAREGHGLDAIAARFGVAPITVKRYLKLAVLSPRVLDAYRDDKLTFEQAAALALSDDHATQERLWFDASPYQRGAQHIRSAITQSEIDASTSPLAASSASTRTRPQAEPCAATCSVPTVRQDFCPTANC
uniref:ParB/RepB/Spo0J family partition protein n=1 Tax=Burkholderia arboris TaxID=488730 RepID=UPI003BEEFA9B